MVFEAGRDVFGCQMMMKSMSGFQGAGAEGPKRPIMCGKIPHNKQLPSDTIKAPGDKPRNWGSWALTKPNGSGGRDKRGKEGRSKNKKM